MGKSSEINQRSKKSVTPHARHKQLVLSRARAGINLFHRDTGSYRILKDTRLKSVLDFTSISVLQVSAATTLSQHSARHLNGTKGRKPSVTTL